MYTNYLQNDKKVISKYKGLARKLTQTTIINDNYGGGGLVAKSCPTLATRGLQPTRLLCLWEFPGKDTEVDCHFLLQGIFLTQESNPGLLHYRQILYRLSYEGSPRVSVATIKKSTSNKCWRGCGEKRILLHCWWEFKLVQSLWRIVQRLIKKLEKGLSYDPAMPLLGIHTEETRIERDMCIPMFITVLHGSSLDVHQRMNG